MKDKLKDILWVLAFGESFILIMATLDIFRTRSWGIRRPVAAYFIDRPNYWQKFCFAFAAYQLIFGLIILITVLRARKKDKNAP